MERAAGADHRLRGEAIYNPALFTPGSLHGSLRRTGNLFTKPLDEVIDDLLVHGTCTTPTAHIRLVAFGSYGHIPRGSTIQLGNAAQFIRSHLGRHRDLYLVTRISDPVLALLALLDKVE